MPFKNLFGPLGWVAAMLVLGTTPALAEARAVKEGYGKLPLTFEINEGQTDPRVQFLARGPQQTLFLTSNEAVFVLTKPEETESVFYMRFAGSRREARIVGQEELPGKANYFIGNNPAKWRTNVRTYAKVKYAGLYPGIDLIYYGNQRQLEYDFVVNPGASPHAIALDFRGALKLEVDREGDLVLHADGGDLRMRKPSIYQEVDGSRRQISGAYIVIDGEGGHRVGFEVGAYDKARPLVIDPVLFYSTYLGGSGNDYGNAITVDAAGNAYVTGATYSTDFPTTEGFFRIASRGVENVFVAKLGPSGTELVYSTYFGGNGKASGLGIAADAAGNAYVTGFTDSTNFPATAGAFQTASRGFEDAFVTKLNSSGTALVYSSYLGGNGTDAGQGIAIDTGGNAYVTGTSFSTNFPITEGAFQTAPGDGFYEAFVTKLSPTGASLVYSTYLGAGYDCGTSIAVDTAGNAYVTGTTASAQFPVTAGAFQTSYGGGSGDAFVTQLNAAGSALVYSTFLGGSGYDFGNGIAVDTAGNAYATGFAGSADFPVSAGAFQTMSGGARNAFVTKLDPTGSMLVYSTYLGGNTMDQGRAIAVDALGNAYVSGMASSTNFPLSADAFQTTYGGDEYDAFVSMLDPSGTTLLYSTYLGGSGVDEGFGIAVDTAGMVYVAGTTNSTDFPATTGAFQAASGGGFDAFVTKIALPPPEE